MKDLPFSQAAENNREPILAVLRTILTDARSVLEVGAGTGQHAVFFAEALPAVRWQATERADAMSMLQPRLGATSLDNLPDPQILDIATRPWSVDSADAIYTANTLHIVSEELVEAFFRGCEEVGRSSTQLIVYGPFNYGGEFTTESNARFDDWLKDRDPRSGVRDFEWVNTLAEQAGYALRDDYEMPANNRLLHWEKSE